MLGLIRADTVGPYGLIEIVANEVVVSVDGKIYADGKFIADCPGEGYMFISNKLRCEMTPSRIITRIMPNQETEQ